MHMLTNKHPNSDGSGSATGGAAGPASGISVGVSGDASAATPAVKNITVPKATKKVLVPPTVSTMATPASASAAPALVPLGAAGKVPAEMTMVGMSFIDSSTVVSSGGTKNARLCSNCKKPGHYANTCPEPPEPM